MRRIFACVLLLGFSCLAAAKDQPFQVVTWPESGQPVLRFSFSKFKEIGGIGKEHTYITEISAENLSPKTINGSSFYLYVFDRSKARVSDGFMNLSNVAAGQTVRFQVTLAVSGIPASVAVATAAATTNSNAPRPVSITVNSVPQGAAVKLDGKELGTTPRTVEIAIGQHMFTFEKEGYNPGKMPLEITSHDASGGSVSYELGSAARDTIELRMAPFSLET